MVCIVAQTEVYATIHELGTRSGSGGSPSLTCFCGDAVAAGDKREDEEASESGAAGPVK